MKKIYLTLLSAIAGLSLQAQLTQANQAPMASYTFQMYHCDSVSTSPGASGANVNWNFSSITTFSTLVNSYLSAAVSGNANYPNASVAVGSSANNTSYYSSTATELDYYGGNISVGPVGATLNYTQAAVVMAYPMSLNTTTTSHLAGTLTATIQGIGGSGTFTGNCTVIADGSGTLTLPGSNSTFTNVLRVVTTQTMDVSITSPAATPATVTLKTYDYYAVGIRNPIFTIATSTAVTGGFFAGTNTQTTVTRDKNASVSTTTTTTTTVNVAEATAPVNLSVYPNPSSTYVQFVSDSQDARTVSVYDITGKLIDRQSFSDGKIRLDVSSLNTGLYIYTVSGSNNRSLKTGKITVNH